MRKGKEEEEKKTLTIYEKWALDSKEPNGGIGFDSSECDGTQIEIQQPNEDKEK